MNNLYNIITEGHAPSTKICQYMNNIVDAQWDDDDKKLIIYCESEQSMSWLTSHVMPYIKKHIDVIVKNELGKDDIDIGTVMVDFRCNHE